MYKNAEIERLTKITEINESYNEVVHNMAHFHKLIEQLARENENKEICEIMKKINGVLNEREAYEYSSSKILNAILSEYFVKSEKVGIKFDVYVEPGCVFSHIENMDLAAMIGNILENAVTAASKKGKGTEVGVRIYMSRNGKQCVVKVINDYSEELKMKDGKLETTKNEKGVHGIGTRSILKTAEKYGGFFEYCVEERKFYAVLVLPV